MRAPCFHLFKESVSDIKLPEYFTNPFHYTPHPLCVMAAKEVKDYLSDHQEWQPELSKGKMFGVLVVRSTAGILGFIAAFSGNFGDSSQYDYFVPPVFDLLQPDGFFKVEESKISAINQRLREMEEDDNYRLSIERFYQLVQSSEQELSTLKAAMALAKKERDQRRKETADPSVLATLIRESQYQKAEYKRQERQWKEKIENAKAIVSSFEQRKTALKMERKQRSAALQLKLFKHFRMLNALGEEKDLVEIFAPTAQHFPPAGAGECAAPKLLQYAFSHQLQPIAMAEFWWGNASKTEIRRPGYFYPSCKGKCEPILKHMLVGLSVEPEELAESSPVRELEILYEDEWLLVVNKPSGQLSVPGKIKNLSIEEVLRERYPEATGPLLVHRLDMSTSGLLLVAKTKEIHQALQKQFEERTVHKEYTAILDGIVPQDEGKIELPICLDPNDRPRQIVDYHYGKPAETRYTVLNRDKGTTRISFVPITGRTHQLRVHAAHPEGLNCPILGDELYGRTADRLYLHATALRFRHPVSGKEMLFRKEADF